MSFPYMVADENREKDYVKGRPPPIEVGNITLWITKLGLFLRAKNRNHLGLKPHGIAQPANNATALAKTEYAKMVDEWETRNDTCISMIHEAVKENTEALEIFQQYLSEKEALPDNAANKAERSQEILEKLKLRFSGEIQDEMAVESAKFTNFKLDVSKPVTTGIDILNGITLKLRQHNLAPSSEAKLAKLIEALNVPELEALWMNISMLAEPSWDLVVNACKKYDKAKKKLREKHSESSPAVHFTEATADKAVCPYCEKAGHTREQCWKTLRDLQNGGDPTGQDPTSKYGNYQDCHVCGSDDHCSDQCPDRFELRRKRDRRDREKRNTRGSRSKSKEPGETSRRAKAGRRRVEEAEVSDPSEYSSGEYDSSDSR